MGDTTLRMGGRRGKPKPSIVDIVAIDSHSKTVLSIAQYLLESISECQGNEGIWEESNADMNSQDEADGGGHHHGPAESHHLHPLYTPPSADAPPTDKQQQNGIGLFTRSPADNLSRWMTAPSDMADTDYVRHQPTRQWLWLRHVGMLACTGSGSGAEGGGISRFTIHSVVMCQSEGDLGRSIIGTSCITGPGMGARVSKTGTGVADDCVCVSGVG